MRVNLYPFFWSDSSYNYFWFRVFGWGLCVGLSKSYPPLFSERYGYIKVLRVFGLRIEALKP